MKKVFIKIKEESPWLLITIFLTWLLPKIFDKISLNIKTLPLGLFFDWLIKWINYRVPIYAIVIFLVLLFLMKKINLSLKINKQHLKIIRASYGANGRFIDIKNELNQSIEGDTLKIVLSNNIAGDPIVGIQKIGVIEYEYKKSKFQDTYVEGDTIDLPRNKN